MSELAASNPWTCLFASLILLLAIVGVIFGIITKGRWADRGLMLKDGHRLKWNRSNLPISVLFHPELFKRYWSTFFKVREMMNKAVGRQVFDVGTEMSNPYFNWSKIQYGMVAIVSGDLNSTEHSYDKRTGEILSAKVTLSDWEDKGNEIMIHELGHVLGLDHDENEDSVMYWSIVDRPQELTKKDKKLLKSLYG